MDFFCRDTICICTGNKNICTQVFSWCLHFQYRILKKCSKLACTLSLELAQFHRSSKDVLANSALLMLNNSHRETWSRLPKSVTHKVVVHIRPSSENYSRVILLWGSFRRYLSTGKSETVPKKLLLENWKWTSCCLCKNPAKFQKEHLFLMPNSGFPQSQLKATSQTSRVIYQERFYVDSINSNYNTESMPAKHRVAILIF